MRPMSREAAVHHGIRLDESNKGSQRAVFPSITLSNAERGILAYESIGGPRHIDIGRLEPQ